jgi:chromosome segregation ATPase
MLASGPGQPAADAWQQSADAAAAASAAHAQLLGRVESLEKELRSALMRLQFMNKQNSTQTLKIESLEARNVALEKEVGRLRALWQSAQVFLDQGAGI